MKKKMRTILGVIFGIILCGTIIYAATSQNMSFEEALQKKESLRTPVANVNIYHGMTKEQWVHLSASEKQKYAVEKMSEEARSGASENLEIIEKGYRKGTLLPPADDVILQLGAAKYKPAVPLLIDILKNYSVTDIRVSAAEALGNIGDETAISVLIEALGYKDYQIKVEAAVALVKLGRTTEAFALLAKVAKKEDIDAWDIDVSAKYTSITFLSKEEINRRRTELQQEIKNKMLPTKALKSLGEIKDNQSINVLAGALFDKNEFVRLEAASQLMATDKKGEALVALDKIIANDEITKSVRLAALSVVAKGKGAEEIKLLKKYEKYSDKELAKAAIKLINEIEGK